MEITYSQIGNYELPNLKLSETKNDVILGKYAKLKLNYLKQNRRGIYTILLMKNELKNYLADVEKIAKEREKNLIKLMAKKEKVDENLKAKIKWNGFGMMNNFKNSAEEIILKEIIYK